jgi:hypothetical protein
VGWSFTDKNYFILLNDEVLTTASPHSFFIFMACSLISEANKKNVCVVSKQYCLCAAGCLKGGS